MIVSNTRSKARAQFVRACLRCVSVDLCRFPRRLEPGVDSDGRCGACDGARATRHARCAQAGRLAFASFFAALFVVVTAQAIPACQMRFTRDCSRSLDQARQHKLGTYLVFRGGIEVFSNVPFVLVAGNWIPRFTDPVLMWKVLALCDDVCRKSNNHRLGCEHDRGGISAQ